MKHSTAGKKPNALLSNQGSSLILVLVLSVIGSIVMSSFMFTTRVTHKLSGNQIEKVAALNIAEAGKENALAQLRGRVVKLSAGSRKTLISETSFGDGSYVVQCSTNASIDTAWVWSTGTKGGQSKGIEVKYAVSTRPDPSWNKGIFANTNINLRGNGNLTGKVHSNTMIDFRGNLAFDRVPAPACTMSAVSMISVTGNVQIQGLLKAPNITITGNNSGGMTVARTDVTNIDCPNPDFSKFRDTAQAHIMRRPGDSYSGTIDWGTIDGGVIWFDGPLTISGNLTFSGLLIATGNITITGNITQTYAPNRIGGIVSTEGQLIIRGKQRLQGLVYAASNIEFSGNDGVEGQIISCGQIEFKGNYGNVDYSPSDYGLSDGTKTYTECSWRELP